MKQELIKYLGIEHNLKDDEYWDSKKLIDKLNMGQLEATG